MAETLKHTRMVYGIIDLIADLGGIYEIFFLVIAAFVGSVAKHSFILKATKKLYKGRTKDESVFIK